MKHVGYAVALAATLAVAGCASGGDIPDAPDGRLPGSGLSPLPGAEDSLASTALDAVARAARSAPIRTSQSSTDDGMTVRVGRDDDGNLVHEFADHGRVFFRVPSPLPRQGFAVAAFTDLIPGIEPDLSSFPHEVLGVWAWEGDAGAFWSRSPEIPAVAFGPRSPIGTATYEGDAVGLHAAGPAVTKFVADVTMTADFDAYTVGGRVDGFRALGGAAIDAPAVDLREAGFSLDGAPFAGDTGAEAVAGTGKWGGRWSDGLGWTMGGTFGFAADDDSVAVLGAFTACSCASVAE